MPCLMRWPARLPKGIVSRQMGITMDLHATFLALAGVPPPRDKPLDGIDLMRRRRTRRTGTPDRDDLCRGPGNLTVALGITLRQNTADLVTSGLRIEDQGIKPEGLTWSRRIGIRVGTEREWRCHWTEHACVSGM